MNELQALCKLLENGKHADAEASETALAECRAKIAGTLKNWKIEIVVKCVTILVVIIVKIIFFRSFLFYCVLYNHSFKKNLNSITNLSKLFNYTA